MKREVAEQIVEQFKGVSSPKLSVEEAMSMTKVKSNNEYQIYAVHKGDFTFMAWVGCANDTICVHTRLVCW